MPNPSNQQPLDRRAALLAALSSLILFMLCLLAYHYWKLPAAAPPVVVAESEIPKAAPDKVSTIGAGGGQSATAGSCGDVGNGKGGPAVSNAGGGNDNQAATGNPTETGNGTAPPVPTAPSTPTPSTPTPSTPTPAEKPKVITRQIGVFTAPPPSPPRPATGGSGREPVLGTGDVQITLRWQGAPDVDLHVTDPSGEKIWFEHRSSRSGGMLDVDDTDYDGPENIFWPKGGAPTGEYAVAVHLYDGNSSQWNIRLLVDGKEQKFSGRLTRHGQMQQVTKFKR